MTGGLAGEGRQTVLKKHLKPADALNNLRVRASHHYDKNYNNLTASIYYGSEIPEMVRPVLQPLIAEIEALKNEEPGVIARGLKSMSADKIAELI